MISFIALLSISASPGPLSVDRDGRAQAIGYRLQTASAMLCPAPAPQPDFFLQGETSNKVSEVIAGSPADQSGLKRDDVIIAVDDHQVSSEQVASALDAAFTGHALDLRLGDGRRVHFAIEQGCGFGISVVEGHALDAWADGQAVALTAAMVDFVHSDDELALIIAHELSHNILRHRRLLDAQHVHRGLLAAFGDSAGLIRRTEEAADVEALYLLARAGYDYHQAPAFWQRFGDRTGAGVFSDGTHPRTRARVELARQTVAQIDALIAKELPIVPPSAAAAPSQTEKSR